MLVIKVELWRHGDPTQCTEIGRAYVANDGSLRNARGSYDALVCRRGSTAVPKPFNPGGPEPTRRGRVEDYPRASYTVWRLITRALLACYPEERATRRKEPA